jgi:hypothetical protein
LDRTEHLFCTYLQHEGIGTLYERIVKGRMLRRLAEDNGYGSVLELGCSVTKGFDNLAFLDKGLDVTVADADIGTVRSNWPFPQSPNFSEIDRAPPADLVWTFARVQLEPAVIETMKRLARRQLLVFVPNVLNPGAPAHFTYHIVTRTPCRHAERGRPAFRTRPGLVRLLSHRGVRVLDSGYVDAPPIPNIAFSIRELKQAMGWTKTVANGQPTGSTRDPARVWQTMQSLTRFEASGLVRPFKFVIAHHIYALGVVE